MKKGSKMIILGVIWSVLCFLLGLVIGDSLAKGDYWEAAFIFAPLFAANLYMLFKD